MRVAVLEDQLLTREGLIRTLSNGGVEVLAAFDNSSALLQSVAIDAPDAVLLDVRLPPTFTDEGLRVAATIRARHPSTAVLVLSQYAELEFVESILTENASSVGYLLKDRLLDPETLLDALRRVVRGECVVDPAIVKQLLDRRTATRPLSELSEREFEVLSCIAEGLTNTGIARRFTISDRTVEAHVQHVFEKLDLGGDSDTNRRVLAALTFLGSQKG
jgi:DNA-binding NarL/FixJ family response regulator